MLDFLTMHWQVITGFFLLAVWVGRHSQRIEALEKDPKVSVSACTRQMTDCKAHNLSEFAHGTREFDALQVSIKTLAERQDEAARDSEARHRELLNILLERN